MTRSTVSQAKRLPHPGRVYNANYFYDTYDDPLVLNGIGRLTKTTSSAGQHFYYDALGRAIKQSGVSAGRTIPWKTVMTPFRG